MIYNLLLLCHLQDIKANEEFNLACRLVKACQGNNEQWSIWVEDGTNCQFTTAAMKNGEFVAYDSQETLAVDKFTSGIQIRAAPKLIVKGTSLEAGVLLFLRKVKTVTESYADSNDRNIVVYFNVIGAVEPLEKSTRDHPNLVKRLNEKAQKELEALQVSAIESVPPIELPLLIQSPQAQQQPTQSVGSTQNSFMTIATVRGKNLYLTSANVRI